MSKFLGPALMLGSSILFALMNLFVKQATEVLPGSEVAFFRFVFGLLMVGILTATTRWLYKRGRLGEQLVRPRFGKPRWLIARGVLGGIAILLLYLALQKGSLTNITVISNSYPVFTTLFSIAMLNERPGILTFGSLAVSIAGVVLMLGGGFGALRAGDILAVASSLFSGIAVVTVRELRKTESTWSVFTSLCSFGGLVAFLYGWKGFVAPSGDIFLYVLGASATGFLAQVLMTAGFRYVTASAGSIMSMSTVLFSGLLGYILLKDRLTSPELLGAILLVAGSIAVGIVSGDSGDAVAGEEQAKA